MLRRLATEQPESFAFTDANRAWAEAQTKKYPEGRQASAIIPLLWRAQEQEGWLSRPAIEYVAEMLGLPYIRALEVATFYFMFQLQPVGKTAHIQVCGTTPCMLRGSEELMAVCREKISKKQHEISEDGQFSWEEVECLGACSNAPMVQIGKDYFEDLDRENFGAMIDDLAKGKVPRVGSQKNRFSSEPESGLTSLKPKDEKTENASGSRALAEEYEDTIVRITGEEAGGFNTEISIGARAGAALYHGEDNAVRNQDAPSDAKDGSTDTAADVDGEKPEMLDEPRDGKADDLKLIKGIGPKLEELLHSLGVYHFDQVANWSASEVAWVDANLEGFNGRVSRDDWVEQAKILANGGETEFSKRES